MASVRDLKKDINFLASELIAQAYLNKVVFKRTNDEELSKLVSDALDFRDEFIKRVNHPDGTDNAKLVKNYFTTLRKDMVEEFGKMLDTVSAISEEAEK